MPPAVRLLFLCVLLFGAQLVLHFRHVLASALRLTVIPFFSRGRLIHASVACAGTASTDHAVTEDVRASLDPGQVMARALGDSAPGRSLPCAPEQLALLEEFKEATACPARRAALRNVAPSRAPAAVRGAALQGAAHSGTLERRREAPLEWQA